MPVTRSLPWQVGRPRHNKSSRNCSTFLKGLEEWPRSGAHGCALPRKFVYICLNFKLQVKQIIPLPFPFWLLTNLISNSCKNFQKILGLRRGLEGMTWAQSLEARWRDKIKQNWMWCYLWNPSLGKQRQAHCWPAQPTQQVPGQWKTLPLTSQNKWRAVPEAAHVPTHTWTCTYMCTWTPEPTDTERD